MKRRACLIVCLIALCLLPSFAASGQGNTPGDVLRLLKFVPDTPDNRSWLTFGDLAAWHESWAIPRIDNVDQLKALDRDPRAYWMAIMPSQTVPPDVLGGNYLLSDDQRSYYGFDLFNVDRFLYAGTVPHEISVVEFSFDGAQIAKALAATGYEAQPLETGGTLYSILQDGQPALGQNVSLPRVGMLGALNRIALLDGLMLISRGTPNIESSLQAQQGTIPSLADDPAYSAAAQALNYGSLRESGTLVGVIMFQSELFAAPEKLLGPNATSVQVNEVRSAWHEQFGDTVLPPFTLVAFATRHAPGASYLALDVVFPAGTDAKAAAQVLSDRLQKYISRVTGQPLADRWTFDRAVTTEFNGLPVALVVMRVDDPPVAAPGELANAGVLSWIKMVQSRDLGFLVTGALGE